MREKRSTSSNGWTLSFRWFTGYRVKWFSYWPIFLSWVTVILCGSKAVSLFISWTVFRDLLTNLSIDVTSLDMNSLVHGGWSGQLCHFQTFHPVHLQFIVALFDYPLGKYLHSWHLSDDRLCLRFPPFIPWKSGAHIVLRLTWLPLEFRHEIPASCHHPHSSHWWCRLPCRCFHIITISSPTTT